MDAVGRSWRRGVRLITNCREEIRRRGVHAQYAFDLGFCSRHALNDLEGAVRDRTSDRHVCN